MMPLLALRLADIGSPLSLILLWFVLGTVFFTLLRRVRRDDDLGTGRGL